MLGLLSVVLATAPVPVKVAVPAFTVVGLDPAIADVYSDHFVTLLGRDRGWKLITQKDIAQVLGLERQKQLLGCGEAQTSCLVELAGALGVDAILSVSIAKTESSFIATVRVIRADDGSELAAATERLKSDDALQVWLDAQAPQLVERVLTAFGRGAPPEPRAGPAAHAPFVRWVPAIGGAALAIGGGILFGLSRGSAARLRSGTIESQATAHSVATTGRVEEGAGIGLLVTGGVAIAAGAVWVFAIPTGEVRVAALPILGGAAATVGGTF